MLKRLDLFFFVKALRGLVNHGGTTGIKIPIDWPY